MASPCLNQGARSMRSLTAILLLLTGFLMSCSESPAPPAQTDATTQPPQPAAVPVETAPSASSASSEVPLPELPVISFGGGDAAMTSKASTKNGGAAAAIASGPETIIARLKELQVLLGTWRGITQKEYGGSKNVDETEWVWDFQTDPQQPALVMESEKSPFYRQAHLTYLPANENYRLTLQGVNGEKLVCEGRFLSEISDVQGDDGKPQRTYKLELTEVGTNPEGLLRLVFNQQNNNRYLLEVYRQRGADDRFFRIDTVSTQREGTSLALIDEGYGEKTCIISGGLGTMTVSHKGQTYYVCCTGCKAAFEDDPERWIARAEEQKKN